MFIGEIDDNNGHTIPPLFATLWINNKAIKFKIDTGADITAISNSTFQMLKPLPQLQPSEKQLESVGTKVRVHGTFHCTAKLFAQEQAAKSYQLHVYVIDGNTNLLSRTASLQMGLITANAPQLHDVSIDPSIFGNIGLMATSPVKIRLRDDAEPYHVGTPRTIPIPLMPRVAEELQGMEASGVITKITDPTDWCSPMSVVPKKSGQIRICVDLRKLNTAVKRESYTLPTIDDILPKLSGSKYYTSLDASRGYWQLPLSDESAKLTTFITHQGRYCFRRLPYGICNASEIFQRKMTELLETTSAVAYQDDIIVFGKTEKEHDDELAKVLDIISKSGLKLNKQKCKFKQTKLSFLGHMISESGVSPDSDKVQAIMELPQPTATTIRSVIGMINFLGRYVPNLQTIMKPMNDLLREDTQFKWGHTQEKSSTQVKDILMTDPHLAYYDPKKETIVTADASSYGVGGAILQKDGDKLLPVAFRSRTLTDTEKGYAQIEKECLAATYACEKFSKFLIGLHHFTLRTDHKPLVPLLSTKDIYKTPTRVQRFLLRLMPYAFTPVHVPGKHMKIADALSRSPLPTDETKIDILDELIDDCEAMVKSLNWPASTSRMELIRRESEKDAQISDAMYYTLHGWPKYVKQLPEDLRNFPQAHLTVADGLLLYDDRLVIPESLRQDILGRLHDGHMGISKCRERARMCVWWPDISRDISEFVSECSHCQKYRPAQRSEPLLPSAPPNGPWKCIAADLLNFNGQDYLSVMDYYSKYIEIAHLTNKTSSMVISRLKSIIARWGIPETIVTDNGPEFRSDIFRKFSQEYDFHHVTSSPHFPQANGQAESGVKIAKSVLRQDDPALALLSYRSTPVSSTGYTPAQLLMGRNIRSTVPLHPRKLEPEWPEKGQVQKQLINHKAVMKRNYDQHNSVRTLPKLENGQKVLIRTPEDKHWEDHGEVKASHSQRSYLVQTDHGVLRRNRRHLMLLPQADKPPEPKPVSLPSTSTTQMPENPTLPKPSPNLPSRRSSRITSAPKRLIEEI